MDENKNPMVRVEDGGVYELFIAGLKVYDSYKYAVKGCNGKTVFKADPYAFHAETSPKTASKIYDLSGYKWQDGEYMKKRAHSDVYSSPVNINELNLASWKRKADGEVY